MTLRTNCRGLGRAQGLESDDLGDVASAIHMRLTRPMAGLTSMLIALQEGSMWRSCKVLVPHFLVTGLADVAFGELAGGLPRQGRGALDRLIRRLLTLAF